MSRYEPVEFDSLDIDCSKLRIALVSAQWNQKYNLEMRGAAEEELLKAGLENENIELYQVPGAYELPVFVKSLTSSITRKYDAIICIATVIRGETLHFELVARDTSKALLDLSVAASIPVLNCVLACEDEKQVKARASVKKENKGAEVAKSALALLNELAKIK